jgi:hypothetical protein
VLKPDFPPQPRVVAAGAAVLAAACLWPLFLVFQWFGLNVATLERLTRTDPLGFRVYPALVMFLRPTLAGLAALSALHAAVLVITSPPQRASRILLPSTIVQGALVLIVFLAGPTIDRTLSTMIPLFEDRRTPGAIVAADFTRMQAEASGSILLPLIAIAVACGVFGMLTRAWRR